LIKIHIGPFQTKNLTLAQTKRQSDRPTCGVAALLGGSQDGAYLLERVRLDWLHLHPGRLRDGGNIARHVSTAQSLAQSGTDSAVHLVSSGWPCASRDHLAVEQLKMFRLQAVESMLPDIRD
jgi:hypothetical protein